MRECSFDAVDWDTLRTVEKNFREINAVLDEHKSDPIAVLSAVYESIQAQSLEDAYRDRKILFFGNFIADLKEPDVENLAKTFKEENISITIVVPNKLNQTDIQKSNIKILEKTFGKTDNATILTLQEAEVRLSNLATKKTVKPTPWSYDLEIGPNLQIPVGYYVCTRKNKSTETKKALIKEVQKLSGAHKEPNELVPVPRADGNSADSDDEGPSSGQIVELTKNIVQKETFWAQTDGTIVEEEDLVEGYYYGDKLVPFDDIQHENQYSTGDKCFKVLLFCPKEVIKPCHLVGDGNDVVFPKKNTPDAEVRFMALVQAMHNLNRIAIVRKVRTKNAKMVIGSLTADLTRKCLLFNELCFADDVSIPYFAPLIKSDAEDDLSEKEKLIDELISSKSIQFVPLEGPVDPNVHKMRQSIAQKFVGPSMIINSEPKDGVDLHFEEIVSGVDDGLLKKLKDSFPIKEIVEKGSDRPSGQQIFRKRARLEIENGDGDSSADKKVKAEDPTEPDPALKTEVDAEAEFDPDNLLDDM
jgi:non-homologous end joining protein Ku